MTRSRRLVEGPEPVVVLRWGTVGVRVAGWRSGRSHLIAELGSPTPEAGRDAAVGVDYGRHGGTRGRHKGTSWTAVLSDPGAAPLSIGLRVRGPFGLALTQSILLEPLFAAAAARSELVALPAAAFRRRDGRPVVVLAASRAGKSSLALEAMIRRAGVIADDRVLVQPDGSVHGVPRRLRLYPDQLRTYGELRARLGATARIGAAARGMLGAVTRGTVRLPILVDPARLGADQAIVDGRPAEIVILQRSSRGTGIEESAVDGQAMADVVRELAGDDRRHLDRHGGKAWQEATRVARDGAVAAIARRWDGVPVRRITVAPASDLRAVIGRVADAIELG